MPVQPAAPALVSGGNVKSPAEPRSTDGSQAAAVNESPGTMTKLHALLVEDDPVDVEQVRIALSKDGFEVTSEVTDTAEGFTRLIRTGAYDIILADYKLPQWRGMDALDVLRRENLDIPVIVVTGYLGEERAVDCIKQGATDCVLKDRMGRLSPSVRRALEEKRLRKERRDSEMELARKVEELARSNRDLEQFAYVASHDLQEPLRMVANYTQLLTERYRGKFDEQADKYLHYAADGALRMQALIQDLLKFSRVGKHQVELRPTESRAIVEQALANLQAAIQESGALVERSAIPVVMADPSQLTQVFQNLIANAIKFHGVEPPKVQIAAEKKGEQWEFAVSDNGIGIPADQQQDIFVIFRRLHGRGEYDGNGIGLAICKKIVERHGGQIWVEAQAGGGSCFKFTLPAEHSRTTQAAHA